MKQQAIQYLALDVHKATDLPLTGADPHAKVSRLAKPAARVGVQVRRPVSQLLNLS